MTLQNQNNQIFCKNCNRLCSASSSKQTRLCGICAGMKKLMPRDIKDMEELGIFTKGKFWTLEKVNNENSA